jgi:hypothetical protein
VVKGWRSVRFNTSCAWGKLNTVLQGIFLTVREVNYGGFVGYIRDGTWVQ